MYSKSMRKETNTNSHPGRTEIEHNVIPHLVNDNEEHLIVRALSRKLQRLGILRRQHLVQAEVLVIVHRLVATFGTHGARIVDRIEGSRVAGWAADHAVWR